MTGLLYQDNEMGFDLSAIIYIFWQILYPIIMKNIKIMEIPALYFCEFPIPI